ncbi:MAG: lipoprotein [Verrucomicrobiota bacterium]
MKKILLILLPLILLAGCAEDQQQTTSEQRVSTIPWNKPERWEGQGQLGGMLGGH